MSILDFFRQAARNQAIQIHKEEPSSDTQKIPATTQIQQTRKKILLIGCSGKLGTAFVRRYAKRYDIIGVARHAPKNPFLLHGFIQADASREQKRIVQTVIDRHGSIDVLINNAVSYDYKPLLEKSIEDFSSELQINLIAPFAFSQELLKEDWLRFTPEENRLQNRLIINIGSVSGTKLRPNINQATYSTAKTALHMLTLHMAAEWRIHGIHANVIAFHGFKGYVSPETATSAINTCINNHLANGCIYLVSDTKTELVK